MDAPLDVRLRLLIRSKPSGFSGRTGGHEGRPVAQGAHEGCWCEGSALSQAQCQRAKVMGHAPSERGHQYLGCSANSAPIYRQIFRAWRRRSGRRSRSWRHLRPRRTPARREAALRHAMREAGNDQAGKARHHFDAARDISALPGPSSPAACPANFVRERYSIEPGWSPFAGRIAGRPEAGKAGAPGHRGRP